MNVKVSPNYVSKLADRIAGAIVDHAYELKKNPRVYATVEIHESKCRVYVSANCTIDKSIVEGIVSRIAGLNEVYYEFNLIDGYEDFSCSMDAKVKAKIEDDNDRRVVSVCNDVYKSTEAMVSCEFEYPNMVVYTEDTSKKVDFCVNHNDISIEFRSLVKPINGTTNLCVDSDMGIMGTQYLHGVDARNPHFALAIYAYLLVEDNGGEVCISCNKGDTIVNGVKYTTIVNKAKAYVTRIGGFEKLAEWGMYRPLVRN